MNPKPKISVILTSYNHAKYLCKSIDSILNQTYRDFELIIWDDASTDNSWEIINSYQDSRIKKFRNTNNESGMYINKAVTEVAIGNFIAIHHSDDIWEPSKLEMQLLFLEEHPEIMAVFTNAQIIGEEDQIFIDQSNNYLNVFNQPNRNRFEWLNYFFIHGNALCHPSVLIRKEFFTNCGLYRYGLNQLGDFDLWVRLCLKYDIHILPEKLVRFRVRDNYANTSSATSENISRIQFEFLQILYNYLQIDSFDELVNIFPLAQKYCIKGGFDIQYILAKIALENKGSKPHELFGIQLLFNALNDSDRSVKIKALYDFDTNVFIRLTGSLKLLTDYSYYQNQLFEILESKTGVPAAFFKKLKMLTMPSNHSLRTRIIKRVIMMISKFSKEINKEHSIKSDMSSIESSGFFDSAWYLGHNPHVKTLQIDPLLHYLLFGGFEGSDPGPYFSNSWYITKYADVRAAGINPLIHYLLFGKIENREIHNSYLQEIPKPFFDKNELTSSSINNLMRQLYLRQFQNNYRTLYAKRRNLSFTVTILFQLKRAIRKLKIGKLPVHIVFIAQDPLDWLSMESLYYATESDPSFQVNVINVGFFWMGTLRDCAKLFQEKGISYLDGIHNRIPLEILYPDIVVVSSPYDYYRPLEYSTESLLTFSKLVYIPYGIDFGASNEDRTKYWYGQDTQKRAWRIFTRSEKSRELYTKYAGIPRRRVKSLGLPLIDEYYSNSSIDTLPEDVRKASLGKFKIIFAPHHTLDGWSTFFQYKDIIRQFILENEDCYLVFRPHPILIDMVKERNIMSEEEFREFFRSDRSCLYKDDDYYSLFKWSDVLISDASSFLGQYAPTHNPIIYLHREDGWGLDESIKEEILNSCYVARSAESLKSLITQLKNKIDPMNNTRDHFQNKICEGMFDRNSGKRIANYIKKILD